ncbi:hypothetical protein [Hyphomonas sp.]|uniref:hypothetical protein n=1 Tax=Hyphomonas sp. TaxID=87 RepID=UPI00391B242F
MQAAPKHAETDRQETAPEGREAAPVSHAAHPSPARALQARLARELRRESNSWTGHSAGLVLVTVLSVWIAAILLNAGI